MRSIITTVLLLTVLVAPAQARIEVRGFGPRVGMTGTPDQVLLGGHMDMGEFTKDLAFRPHLMLGLGDNLTTFTAAGDVYYRFTLPDSSWRPTVGGTLGVYHINPEHGGDHTDLSLQATGGLEKRLSGGTEFHFQLKLELVDAPDITFLTSWTF